MGLDKNVYRSERHRNGGVGIVDIPDLGVGPFQRQSARAAEISESLAADVFDRYQDSGEIISIRPYKGEGTLTTAESFLTSLHLPRTKWRGITRNVTDPSAFEIVFDSERELLQFRYVGGNENQRELLKTELEGHYQDAEIAELPPAFMNVAEGKHVAAARLRLRKDDYLIPIKNYHDDREWFDDRDPYDSITQRMTGTATAPDTDILVQIVMKPALSDATWSRRNWFHGIEKTVDDVSTTDSGFNYSAIVDEVTEMAGAVGHDVGKLMGKESRHRRRNNQNRESGIDRWTTETQTGGEGGISEGSIRRNRGKKGFWWNIRIIAVGDDPEEATKRVERTANAYETFYASQFQQGFAPEFVSKRKVSTLLKRAAGREYTDLNQVFGVHVMNGVSRIPVVSTQQADYTLSKSDQGVPPRTPRFEEFDETGYTAGDLPTTSWVRFKSDDIQWPYAFTPAEEQDPRNVVNDREIRVQRDESEVTDHDDEDLFGGGFPQATLENSRISDENPIWIGNDTNDREVPITSSEWNRHLFIFGIQGAGKSTTNVRVASNHINRGAGIAFIDPGGEDTYKLLMAMDPERFDDVIVMDSGSGFSQYRVGFNLMDTFSNPGDPGFAEEVDAKLGVLLPLLETDDYARMKRVSSHILRGLIEADYLDQDPDRADQPESEKRDGTRLGEGMREMLGDDLDQEVNYTLADAYDILASDENRQAWYEMLVEQELDHLIPYGKTLAEMKDNDNQLEPVLGRMKEWLESPSIRGFVAQRESTISIPDIVLNGKILIVKVDSSNKEIRRMVSATVSRMIWATVLQLPSPKEQYRMAKRDIELPGRLTHEGYDGWPEFYLNVDELHSVISEAMDLGDMLAEARKRHLGLILLTQQLHQLSPDQQEDLANVARFVSFNPGSSDKERRAVASMFPGISKDELADLPDYVSYTMGPEKVPHKVFNYAPPAPRNTFDEVDNLITAKMKEHGIHKDKVEQRGLPERFPDQVYGGNRSISIESDGDDPSVATADRVEALRAFYDACLEHDADAVTLDQAEARLRWYLGWTDTDEVHNGMLQDLKDRLTQHGLESVRHSDNAVRYRLNPDIAEEIVSSGTTAGAGKEAHRHFLPEVQHYLTRYGARVDIVTQSDGDDADFIVEYPDQNSAPTRDSEREAALETFRENNPVLGALTPHQTRIVGELESTTTTRPAQTIDNLAAAFNRGEDTILAVPDGGDDGFERYAQRVGNTLTSPPMVSEIEDDRTILYMKSNFTTADGTMIWRPDSGSRTRWWVDHETDDIVLGDESDNEFGRFDRTEMPNGPSRSSLASTDCHAAPKSEKLDSFVRVQKPRLPEVVGVDDVDPESWTILILPNTDQDCEPAVYVDGKCIPLSEATYETVHGDRHRAMQDLETDSGENPDSEMDVDDDAPLPLFEED